MTQTFAFFFGGFPQLSLAELKFLLPDLPIKLIQPKLALVSNLDFSRLEKLQLKLGGTSKIAQLISNHVDPNKLTSELQALITSSSAKNVAFTNYSSLNLSPDFISQLKSAIQRPVRFLSFQTKPHSLVALRKQHVLEFNLLPVSSTNLALAKTIWIQDSDQWVKLDRHRPYQDIKRGMLPPKVARIMINLATQLKTDGFLGDPFCGTGTIPLEASRLGFQVFASDLDPQAVAGTQKNLKWLLDNFPKVNSNWQLKTLDAVHLSQAVSQLDFIVTEPFMGTLLGNQLRLTPQQLKNNIKGLHKLYLGALKDWRHALNSEGRVVMIFPEFHLFNKIWKIPLIDTCENLGYNKLAQLSYSKPNAKVVRQILILQKSDH